MVYSQGIRAYLSLCLDTGVVASSVDQPGQFGQGNNDDQTFHLSELVVSDALEGALVLRSRGRYKGNY